MAPDFPVRDARGEYTVLHTDVSDEDGSFWIEKPEKGRAFYGPGNVRYWAQVPVDASFPEHPGVKITVDAINGVLGCSAVQRLPGDSRYADPADLAAGRYLPGGPPLSGTLFRRMPIDTLVRRIAAQVTYSERERDEPGPVRISDIRLQREAEPPVRPSRRERRRYVLTDEMLREVAALYRQAIAEKKPPIEAVRLHWYPGSKPESARRLVARARAAGFLGPALRGRAGELETLGSNALTTYAASSTRSSASS